MAQDSGLEEGAWVEQLTQDRRHLHQHPELAFHEHETAAYIAARLRGMGLQPVTLLDGTAVVVDIAGREAGRNLLLRADIDALPIQERGSLPFRSAVPGVMHACGHDGHTAIALATADRLARLRRQWAGTVRIAFQPAEEQAGGAEPMIAAGVTSAPRPDGVLGLHLWSGLEVGSVGVRDGAIFASADEFRIDVVGRGGHGALPHQALDPVPIASTIVLALQTLVSRETSPAEQAVITVGALRAGESFNVIPETAQLVGTLRTFSDRERERLLRRLGELSAGIAAGFGARAQMSLGRGCPPVVSEPAMCELVRRAVRRVEGAQLVEAPALTVGDDVALFLRQAPGCYFLLGSGGPGAAPHHHPEFDLDERCLRLGAEVMAQAALDFLGAA